MPYRYVRQPLTVRATVAAGKPARRGAEFSSSDRDRVPGADPRLQRLIAPLMGGRPPLGYSACLFHPVPRRDRVDWPRFQSLDLAHLAASR